MKGGNLRIFITLNFLTSYMKIIHGKAATAPGRKENGSLKGKRFQN
jgi:hypothetical protein